MKTLILFFAIALPVLVIAQCPVPKAVSPASPSVVCGPTTTSVVSISGAEDEVTYCLVKDGSLVSGSCKLRSGTLVSWNVNQSGEYSVYATKVGCAGATYMSNTATITFASPGTLSITPLNPSPVCYGGSVTLTAVGGTGGYTWSTNGGVIDSDATKSTFKVESTGYYRVSGNVNCSAPQTTDYVLVTVYPDLNGGTVSGPGSVCSGSSPFIASVTAAVGAGSFSYQWESRELGGSWSEVLGATSLSLNAPAITVSTEYRRKVTTSCGVAYSNNLNISVVLPSVGGTSSNGEGFGSKSGTLIVTGYTGTLLKWQKLSGAVWTDILASASNLLDLVNVTSTTSYRAVTQNTPCPEEYSTTGVVTILPVPVITVPGASTISFRTTTQLVTTAGYYAYQWQREETDIPGATTNTYEAKTEGNYRVRIKASASSSFYTTASRFIGTIFNNESNDWNYIQTLEIQKPGVTSANEALGLAADEYDLGITYYDGLGRTIQNVNQGASPAGKDVVQPIIYNHLNRESKKFLPYVTVESSGDYKADFLTEQASFYDIEPNVAHDESPYSQIVFEGSPLNRVVEQGAPGASWQPGTNHTIKKKYLRNGANEVLLFYYEGGRLTSTVGWYNANELLCTKTIDEENNDVLEYVDKVGHVVCKKVKVSAGVYASTYYVYDDLGNLVVVIPPEGVVRILNPNGN